MASSQRSSEHRSFAMLLLFLMVSAIHQQTALCAAAGYDDHEMAYGAQQHNEAQTNEDDGIYQLALSSLWTKFLNTIIPWTPRSQGDLQQRQHQPARLHPLEPSFGDREQRAPFWPRFKPSLFTPPLTTTITTTTTNMVTVLALFNPLLGNNGLLPYYCSPVTVTSSTYPTVTNRETLLETLTLRETHHVTSIVSLLASTETKTVEKTVESTIPITTTVTSMIPTTSTLISIVPSTTTVESIAQTTTTLTSMVPTTTTITSIVPTTMTVTLTATTATTVTASCPPPINSPCPAVEDGEDKDGDTTEPPVVPDEAKY